MAPLGSAAFLPPPPLLAGALPAAAPLGGHRRCGAASSTPRALPLDRPSAGRRPRPPLPLVTRRPLPPQLPPPPSSRSTPPPLVLPCMAQAPPPPPLHSRRGVLVVALATAAATAAAAAGVPRAAAAADAATVAPAGPYTPPSPGPAVATATTADGVTPTPVLRSTLAAPSASPVAAALKPAAVPAIGVTLRVPPTWGRDTVVSTARFVSSTGRHGPTAAWQNTADPRENVSVVVAPVAPGASLGRIGPPAAFGRRLAATLSVPVGAAGLVRSGLGAAAPMARRAVLLMARSRGEVGGATAAAATAASAVAVTTAGAAGAAGTEGGGDQGLYYEIEYEVITPMWRRRNVSAVCIKHDTLYTLNIQAPGERWEEMVPMMRAVAASFSVQ